MVCDSDAIANYWNAVDAASVWVFLLDLDQ